MTWHVRIPVLSLEQAEEAALRVEAHMRQGGLVVYPTETVYGVGGTLHPEALRALSRVKPRPAHHPYLLLISGPDQVEALHWSPAARSLADRFWPGPLTLILPDPDLHYPSGVRNPEGGVAVRVSPHPVPAALLRLLGEPITSSSANRPGHGAPRAPPGPDFLEHGGTDLVLLDGGELAPSPPSTLVDCTGEVPRLIREGAIVASEIPGLALPEGERRPHAAGRQSVDDHRVPSSGSGEPVPGEPFRILFVCTGNTCRSPMAEALARRQLAQRGWRTVEVRSAGVASGEGGAASPGAMLAAEQAGLDLRGHRTRSVDRDLLDWADLILAMSPHHLAHLQELGDDRKGELLTAFVGSSLEGVTDPFGGAPHHYEATLRLLDELIARALDRLEPLVDP